MVMPSASNITQMLHAIQQVNSQTAQTKDYLYCLIIIFNTFNIASGDLFSTSQSDGIVTTAYPSRTDSINCTFNSEYFEPVTNGQMEQ
jgi:hypothetical protein